MKEIAFMFPGQGSQAIGMGQQLYEQDKEIQNLYELANDVLGKNITNLMFHGPKDLLTETENAQPALLLSSIAAFTLLKRAHIVPKMVIGHSLGEYSALVAAGSLSLRDALPLVQTRGRLMEKAFPKGQGTMAAVLGLDEASIKKVLQSIASDEIVDIANINCPGQIVISGSQAGIEEASKLLKDAGAKRVLPLNVSGPFHSRLMKAASEEFAGYLNKVDIKDATIPVYANVTAKPVTNKAEIKDLLIKQLYSPVQFSKSIEEIVAQDVDAFVEVGTGKVLSGLVKKINRKSNIFQVNDSQSLNDFITWHHEEM